MKKEDIKIGATVRVTGAYTASWNGTEYIVTEHRPLSYDSTRELVVGKVTKSSAVAAGDIIQFHSHQLELVELEDKLKVGDKARYIGDYSPDWNGIEGVVEAVETDIVTFKVTKGNAQQPEGKVLWPYLRNLEKVPAFTFKDIKVGDRVRRTQTWADTGTVKITEGVVDTITFSNASTKEFLEVGYSGDDKSPSVKLELLERPEPHFTETAEVGTRYSVKSQRSDRFDFLFTKLEDGKWEKLHLKAAHTCTITNEGAKNFMDQREYKLIK